MNNHRTQSRFKPQTRPTAEPEHESLTVGRPDDALEQEADRMASRATEQPPLAKSRANGEKPSKVSQSIQPKGKADARSNPAPWVQSEIMQQRGGGEALPEETRAQMEPGFSADFSAVRIHTDNKANDLNNNLNARAFTVGSDIWFGQNQFDPQSKKGKKLIAHELTHTVQQGGQAKAIQKDGPEQPATEAATSTAAPKHTPSFSQERNTCVPSSIVTALMTLDSQNAAAGTPSTLLANALTQGMDYFVANEAAIRRRLAAFFSAEDLERTVVQSFLTLRAGKALVERGQALSDRDYKELGKALYLMVYNHNAGSTNIWDAGLNTAETAELQRVLAVNPTGEPGGLPTSFMSAHLEENFDNTLTNALKPGQVVQVITEVGQGGIARPHAYIMGRTVEGTWYINDQAYRPAKYIEAATKEELFGAVLTEIADNNYWLLKFTNSKLQLISP